jgi:hypothetical protein
MAAGVAINANRGIDYRPGHLEGRNCGTVVGWSSGRSIVVRHPLRILPRADVDLITLVADFIALFAAAIR